jgi:epsilon-lactone hydrolase
MTNDQHNEAQPTTEEKPFLHIPKEVSPEFQAYLRTLKDPALMPRFPDPSDLDNWKKVQAFAEKEELAISAPVVQRYAPIVTGLTC